MADLSFPPAHDHAYRPVVQPSLERACRALDAGRAIVVPNPPPMAYGMLATAAVAINALKGRALDQAVAVSLHDESEWQRLAPSIDVPPTALAAVVALLERRLSLLVPLRSDVPHPHWMRPAVRDGYLCLFDGRWSRTAPVWDQFPRLFGSSANLTGQAPAASEAEVIAMFGTDCPVVDADAAGDPPRRRTASTIVRFDRDGRIALHRKGIHDVEEVLAHVNAGGA